MSSPPDLPPFEAPSAGPPRFEPPAPPPTPVPALGQHRLDPVSATPSIRPTIASGNPRRALVAVYRMMVKSLARRGRVLGLGLLGAAAILVAFAIHASHPYDPLRGGAHFVNDFGLTALIPVTCLVFASAALGDLTDDNTLVYLWLRPMHRSRLAIAAFAAAFTICLPLVGIPLVISALLIGGGAELVSGTTVAVIVAVAAYCAIFTALGVRVRRALPWGLAYILLWEGFAATAGRSAGRLAVRSYSQSILSEYTGISLRLARFSLGTSITVSLLVTLAAIAYATRRLRVQDVA